MRNIQNLFDEIEPFNHKSSGNYLKQKIRIKDRQFSSKSIFKILEHIKWMKINNLKNCKLKIVVESLIISDEATLMVFETIIYYVIKYEKIKISYMFNVNKNLIGYEMFKLSNLSIFNNLPIREEKYTKLYEVKFYLYQNHFRKLCENNPGNLDNNYLSITMSEISTFLYSFSIDDNYISDLSEVITEIVGNTIEHSDSDCLLDIKILENKKGRYKFLNVTTLSLGNIFIGTKLKDYINNPDKSGYNTSNEIVIEAYNKHKDKFNGEYDIDSFSTISAFQKYVTTRSNSEGTGGSGLTTLIKALIEKSDGNYCYMLSGKDIIFFADPYLELTIDGLIGFNNQNDYINEIPDVKAVTKSKYRFNATIYNLAFFLKER